MTVTISQQRRDCTARQSDRRRALGELLASLASHLDGRGEPPMRVAFEESLRRVVSVRSVQLREEINRWTTRHDAAAGSESIAFEVAGSDPASSGVLEATFDPECRLGEWDFQILGLAARVGALVLEIDRLRGRLARTGSPCGSRFRRDGAAPLIGSTPVMQALRSSIERVAGTDFTVLLEGESGR
jgi:hypothetical protein